MARETVAKQKRIMTRKRLLLIGLLSGVIVVFVLFSSHGLISRWGLSGDRTDLNREMEVLQAGEDSLQALIHRLETDTIAIERLARERYGYKRPGEKVYIIQHDSSEGE